ncbi:TspO/MBR family protein [Roseibium polysiphoniae]|uniref:Tryptophan-rich sensory protein n=1 Tax=Roseibium polysiphoniae TaxID=2571221 RepID=A0ABR9CEH0_9HYPH|nr:TspO/MBR family protein [Roseibium polysiphoniae]MBD8877282.1 tryptophan-rich sensory protein [Roseibium polysiphoniae]
MERWFGLAVFLFAVVGGGLLIGATNLPGEWYLALEKPAFTPPGWVFGPAWTTLYLLIAIAGWRTWSRTGHSAVFSLWVLQMGLNFVWSPIVFTAHGLGAGLAVILVMLVTILAFIRMSWGPDRLAALCFVPYALWVAFASYLNAGLFLLN